MAETNVTKELRTAAARELTRWHLGSSAWADDVLRAFDNPVAALRRLAADQDDFSGSAKSILEQHGIKDA